MGYHPHIIPRPASADDTTLYSKYDQASDLQQHPELASESTGFIWPVQ